MKTEILKELDFISEKLLKYVIPAILLLFLSIFFLNHYQSMKSLEENSFSSLKSQLDDPIAENDGARIYKTISSFEKAVAGINVCLKLSSGIVIGKNDCEQREMKKVKLYLQDIEYALRVDAKFINRDALIIFSITSILFIIFVLVSRRIHRIVGLIQGDLKLIGQESSSGYTTKEMDQLHSKLLERFQMKEKIQDLQRSEVLGDFARKVMHDIRSPLNSLRRLISEENVNQKERLSDEINFIEGLTHSLLSGAKSSKIEKINLSSTVRQILEKKEKEQTSIIFEGNVPEDLHIVANPIELKAIILNLINNAVEEGVTAINLRGERISRGVTLSVEDNGTGFNKDLLDKYGRKELDSTKANGNGIGLMYARKYMETIDGEILFSNSPSGGVVTLYFPSLNDGDASDYLESKTHVLIDDDSYLQEYWEMGAKKAGLNFLSFSGKEELIQSLDQIPDDSFFYTDFNLPDDDTGVELSDYLAEAGYENLYITTSFKEGEFVPSSNVKGVLGKMPPWDNIT